MKKIISDCDGVLLDWSFAFDVWMAEQGYQKLPGADEHFSQTLRYAIDEDEEIEGLHQASIGFNILANRPD